MRLPSSERIGSVGRRRQVRHQIRRHGGRPHQCNRGHIQREACATDEDVHTCSFITCCFFLPYSIRKRSVGLSESPSIPCPMFLTPPPGSSASPEEDSHGPALHVAFVVRCCRRQQDQCRDEAKNPSRCIINRPQRGFTRTNNQPLLRWSTRDRRSVTVNPHCGFTYSNLSLCSNGPQVSLTLSTNISSIAVQAVRQAAASD